jgi:hypothetical protein
VTLLPRLSGTLSLWPDAELDEVIEMLGRWVNRWVDETRRLKLRLAKSE